MSSHPVKVAGSNSALWRLIALPVGRALTGDALREDGLSLGAVIGSRVNLGFESRLAHVVDDIAAEVGERQPVDSHRDESVRAASLAVVKGWHQAKDLAVVPGPGARLGGTCPDNGVGEDVAPSGPYHPPRLGQCGTKVKAVHQGVGREHNAKAGVGVGKAADFLFTGAVYQ
jgi:hypothetical protein